MAAALEYYYAIEGHSAVKEYKKKSGRVRTHTGMIGV